MAIQMSSVVLFFSSVLLVYVVMCCAQKAFSFEEKVKTVQVSSLAQTPTTCTPSSKGQDRGNREAFLKVVHIDGPCSPLNQGMVTNHTEAYYKEMLRLDQLRVQYINHRILSQGSIDHVTTTSVTLPAKPGAIIGSASYVITLGFGTPKRDQSLIFDTGGDVTWIQCQPCSGTCYKQFEPIYDPSKSSTYTNVACNSSACALAVDAAGDGGCSGDSKCVYGLSYGDGSTSVEILGRERLTLTRSNIFDNYLFGCGVDQQGLFGGSAGLVGLGQHPISFVQQTAKKFGKIFSYCLPSKTSYTGHLTFGSKLPKSLSVFYTPFSKSPNTQQYYGIDVVGMALKGVELPIPTLVLKDAGVVVDSGTVITRLPPKAYRVLRDAFRKVMSKYPLTTPFSILDTCYDMSRHKMLSYPKVSFLLKGGAVLDLEAKGIFLWPNSTKACLGFAANKEENEVPIFGSLQQRTLEVVYDIGRRKIGFAQKGCH